MRTDSASRVIQASPDTIYEAFLNPEAVKSWRPPEGMTCTIHSFEPRVGGRFRMPFIYTRAGHAVPGKTSEHADVFEGRFLELRPGRKIVEEIAFESGDPAFAGAMRVITTLSPAAGGTEVEIRCENVPRGIRRSDHEAGIASTLANLAAFTERER